jgi:hypothetical protein
VAPALPEGCRFGGGIRGVKNPGAPVVSAWAALSWLKIWRPASPEAASGSNHPIGLHEGCAVISFQKFLSIATRSAGAFPAMMAALIAPMEMPATQSGSMPASANA